MTLFVQSLDRQKGPAWAEQLYSVWLSPNLPQASQEENLLEWEGLLEAQLTRDQYRSIKAKVFQKDLLEGTIIGNLQKIFVMPIYRELSNLHLLTQWRSSLGSNKLNFDKLRSKLTGGATEQFQLCEASDYMKRVCEHFKAFI